MNKANAFNKGILSIARKIAWRTLYTTSHRLTQYPNLSNYEIALNLLKFGLVYTPNEQRIRESATKIKNAIYAAIIQNKDTNIVYNYHMLTADMRIKFAQNTLLAAHDILSRDNPRLRSKLRDVFFDTTASCNTPLGSTTMGYYLPSESAIGLGVDTLICDDISTLIQTLSHEYVHVLQAAFASTLPARILRTIEQRYDANMHVPYFIRIEEREAIRISNQVSRKFLRGFQEYTDNNTK